MKTTTPRAPLAAPAATAKQAIQRVWRRLQPWGRQSREYSAAGACDRDPWAAAPPAVLAAEPCSSQRGNGTGTADAVQQCHPPLEQPMGLSSGDGAEKGR